MSRRILAISLVVILAAGIGVAGEKAWFDPSCGMCKPMADTPGLMENIQWEQHNLSNGIVAITTVPEKHLAAYRSAHGEMEKIAAGLEKGKMVEMCGSCMALGKCLMGGANQEYVETSNGDVWIVTSDNPEIVTGLQEWVKRNKEEMAKMKPAKPAEG